MYNALDYNTVVKAVKEVKNGTMVRVSYASDVKLKKAFRDLGCKVTKIVDTTVRLGVNYSNIRQVIENRENSNNADTIKRVNNYTWIIPNKIKYNSNTDEYYLQFANVKNHNNVKVKYIVTDECGETSISDSIDSLPTEMFCATGSGNMLIVQTVKVKNILKIGKVGC